MTDKEWEEAVKGLHKEWDSPDLWQKIAQSIGGAGSRRQQRRWLVWMWPAVAIAAAAMLVVLFLPGLRKEKPRSTDLLTEQTFREVEAAEAAYRASIDRLAKLAAPKLEGKSPLMAAYAEKLATLDGAIAAIRSEIERNGFNAHLRAQAAVLYREKQQTLEEVLHYDANRTLDR